MREPDFDPFVSMLDDVAALLNHGKPLTAGYKSMFFRAVAKHPLDVVRNGFDAHVKDPQRGRFMPVPADILAQIEAHGFAFHGLKFSASLSVGVGMGVQG